MRNNFNYYGIEIAGRQFVIMIFCYSAIQTDGNNKILLTVDYPTVFRFQYYFVMFFFQTRMQILVPDPRANYRNIADAFYRIIRQEGILRTIRGINVMACGAGPAHAMYFACYEKMKSILCRTGRSNHLAHGNTYIDNNKK